MAKVYLGLGTNLGDKEKNLRTAILKIEKQIGNIHSLSAFYATAPWGFISGNNFLNAVVSVETPLSPYDLLDITKQIEWEVGRTHKSVNNIYADRLIDIDLLLYADCIINTPDLTLPHPLMHERRFVMEPLAEIAPNLMHPVLGKTMQDILQKLSVKD